MKTLLVSLALAFLLSGMLPLPALAHEHRTYEIGGTEYSFTMGSLNEPIAVDDKTGVDLMVTMSGQEGMEGEDHHDAGMGAEGLAETLQVEISAGDRTKVLPLEPKFGEPGGYRATFIPTVQTTYTYRVFGTINDTPVNLSFSCNPAGHPVAEEDMSRRQISPGVVQTHSSGAFGCPVAKADLGFPEPAASTVQLAEGIASSGEAASSAGNLAMGALLVGGLGLLAGAGAFLRKRR